MAQESHSDSGHHIYIPARKGDGKKMRHLFPKDATWKLLTSHWPELSHMDTHLAARESGKCRGFFCCCFFSRWTHVRPNGHEISITKEGEIRELERNRGPCHNRQKFKIMSKRNW